MKQKLEIQLISKVRDIFGVWEITVNINGKLYTYPIDAEYGLKKIKKMIRLKKYGKALHLLNLYKIKGFNSFKNGGENGRL